MENTPRLYSEVVALWGQAGQWPAERHLDTLGRRVVGLSQSGGVSLTAGIPFVSGRARYAPSSQRRFARWRQTPRLKVHRLSAPLLPQALAEWGKQTVYLALDTTRLGNRYGTARSSVISRGRAVPWMWQGLEQGSSSVASEADEALLAAVPPRLAQGVTVVFLAERGFADTPLGCQRRSCLTVPGFRHCPEDEKVQPAHPHLGEDFVEEHRHRLPRPLVG